MRLYSFLAVLCAVPVCAIAQPIDTSPRPLARPGVVLTQAVPPVPRPLARPVDAPDATPVVQVSQAGLDAWVVSFRPRALAAGIRPDVFDRAFRGVRYDADVIRRDRNQNEFTKTLWDYLDTAVSDSRVRNGRDALRRHGSALQQIESYYGVDKEIIAAIWGLESSYGAIRGDVPIIGAMATLAYDGRRGAFFESQLIAALRILQAGDVSLPDLKGSWAGAMGHTQFMPTSFLQYAVDATGDGRRDIWSDDPTDALASTAAYLKQSGWIRGMPWGVEVRLPRGFDYAQARRDNLHMPSEWARMGVVGIDGRAVPDYGSASVLVPAGAEGAAFLIFKNFAVIERYNTADAYVIGVGHLADRIGGAGPIQHSWPRGDRALSYAERQELQRRLTAAGFDTRGVDGRIGPLTIEAIRAYQRSIGQVPDGYASLRLLTRLR